MYLQPLYLICQICSTQYSNVSVFQMISTSHGKFPKTYYNLMPLCHLNDNLHIEPGVDRLAIKEQVIKAQLNSWFLIHQKIRMHYNVTHWAQIQQIQVTSGLFSQHLNMQLVTLFVVKTSVVIIVHEKNRCQLIPNCDHHIVCVQSCMIE